MLHLAWIELYSDLMMYFIVVDFSNAMDVWEEATSMAKQQPTVGLGIRTIYKPGCCIPLCTEIVSASRWLNYVVCAE